MDPPNVRDKLWEEEKKIKKKKEKKKKCVTNWKVKSDQQLTQKPTGYPFGAVPSMGSDLKWVWPSWRSSLLLLDRIWQECYLLVVFNTWSNCFSIEYNCSWICILCTLSVRKVSGMDPKNLDFINVSIKRNQGRKQLNATSPDFLIFDAKRL